MKSGPTASKPGDPRKYLKLRYQLMPYTYSIAYRSYQTGAPYMRALFMDFPSDPEVAEHPRRVYVRACFPGAPVVEQGGTSRKVYLPAGCDWYDYWTSKRFKGGQTDRPFPRLLTPCHCSFEQVRSYRLDLRS